MSSYLVAVLFFNRYGRLYCLQVDRLAMELNIYRFYRDAVVPQVNTSLFYMLALEL